MAANNKIFLLDCTLRDGGYHTNWDFSEKLVKLYLETINQLPIDIIEIGYRSPSKGAYHGAYFYLPDFLIEQIRERTDKKLALILNEKEVTPEITKKLLINCKNISLVRLAVAPKNIERGLELSKTIKNLGFQVSLNLMYASTWDSNTLSREVISDINKFCDYFYIVDSYGALFPEQVAQIVSELKKEIFISLGFHGHNNLEMALINTLAAKKAGARILDATISGMGRGAGNLSTELLLSVMAHQEKLQVDFDILYRLSEAFSSLKQKYKWGTSLPYMISGNASLPQDEVISQVKKRYFSLNEFTGKSVGKPGSKYKSFFPENRASEVLVVGGGATPQLHAKGLLNFLKKKPNLIIIHASSKNVNIFNDITNKQVHILQGKELQRLSEKLDKELLFKRTLVTPCKVDIPETLNDLQIYLMEVSKEELFANSVTKLSLLASRFFKPHTIFVTGYDGYEDLMSRQEMELFEENEQIFSIALNNGTKLCSITPTLYNLPEQSVYSF